MSRPTLEELASYVVSQGLQQHIDTLLERNRKGRLSLDERLDLEKILAVSHVMTLVKTKAKLILESDGCVIFLPNYTMLSCYV